MGGFFSAESSLSTEEKVKQWVQTKVKESKSWN